MIVISNYIKRFDKVFPEYNNDLPWNILNSIQVIIDQQILSLGSDFMIKKDIAIHKNATIEEGVILKGPIIISSGCFIGAHAYLRGSVFLDEKTSIGPGCEVKSSLLFGSALAHFNFVGDSILGSEVNLEAGAVLANHYNDRKDKSIQVSVNGERLKTGVTKFGSLIGDGTKIGANAVLSPGTILLPESIVGRLELVNQNPV